VVKIAVIGAGVVGALIAREACKYEAEVHLFERRSDVGWGITKANSAIIHAGFHDTPGSVRARFCQPGNQAFPALCEELDVPLAHCGGYVLAFTPQQKAELEKLRYHGECNHVEGLVVHSPDEIHAREPNVSPDVRWGLWSPTVAITEPWALSIAATENAVENGLILHISEEVTGLRVDRARVVEVETGRGAYAVDIVINAAGLFADRISAMAGVDFPELFPRRGEYILLDRRLRGFVNSVLFPAPTRKSKGILVLPTIDGGILLGPNAQDLKHDAKGRVDTTSSGLREVEKGARKLVPSLSFAQRVKTFAGLRPETVQRDFVVGTTHVQGFLQAAAMRSPGLTASASLAPWLIGELATAYTLERKASFQGRRKAIPKPSELDEDRLHDLIQRDPRYGHVVCYCNEVTEGEIIEAIRRGARSIDGVKFRTRAGFGRCQGGSCSARILRLLARELGADTRDVPQNEPAAWIVSGKARDDG